MKWKIYFWSLNGVFLVPWIAKRLTKTWSVFIPDLEISSGQTVMAQGLLCSCCRAFEQVTWSLIADGAGPGVTEMYLLAFTFFFINVGLKFEKKCVNGFLEASPSTSAGHFQRSSAYHVIRLKAPLKLNVTVQGYKWTSVLKLGMCTRVHTSSYSSSIIWLFTNDQPLSDVKFLNQKHYTTKVINYLCSCLQKHIRGGDKLKILMLGLINAFWSWKKTHVTNSTLHHSFNLICSNQRAYTHTSWSGTNSSTRRRSRCTALIFDVQSVGPEQRVSFQNEFPRTCVSLCNVIRKVNIQILPCRCLLSCNDTQHVFFCAAGHV